MYFVVNCERLFKETGSCDIKLGLAAKYMYFMLRIHSVIIIQKEYINLFTLTKVFENIKVPMIIGHQEWLFFLTQ